MAPEEQEHFEVNLQLLQQALQKEYEQLMDTYDVVLKRLV